MEVERAFLYGDPHENERAFIIDHPPLFRIYEKNGTHEKPGLFMGVPWPWKALQDQGWSASPADLADPARPCKPMQAPQKI